MSHWAFHASPRYRRSTCLMMISCPNASRGKPTAIDCLRIGRRLPAERLAFPKGDGSHYRGPSIMDGRGSVREDLCKGWGNEAFGGRSCPIGRALLDRLRQPPDISGHSIPRAPKSRPPCERAWAEPALEGSREGARFWGHQVRTRSRTEPRWRSFAIAEEPRPTFQ